MSLKWFLSMKALSNLNLPCLQQPVTKQILFIFHLEMLSSCFFHSSFHVSQAEPLSYVGPGEIIGIGVLAFVIVFLLILFIAFRKKIKFRKESDAGPGTGAAMSISTVSADTDYTLPKSGARAEGIEFKAVRLAGSSESTGIYGEVGGSAGGPPQVMVRPTAHSVLPGVLGSQSMRSAEGDRTTSSESSQVCQTVNWQAQWVVFISIPLVYIHFIYPIDFYILK